MQKEYILRYNVPAADYESDVCLDSFNSRDTYKDIENPWESHSLPIGNGYLGACVFGGTVTERIQITENSFANPMGKRCGAGLNNLAEIYINFDHREASDYERNLSINNAVASTKYNLNGANYKREYFASATDKVLVLKLTTDKKDALSFTFRVHSPFDKDYCQVPGDDMGKKSEILVENNRIILTSLLNYYQVIGELVAQIETDGVLVAKDGVISVTNATEALVYVSVGTNYELCEQVFSENEPQQKLKGMPHPHTKVMSALEKAVTKGYSALLDAHLKEHSKYFDRVEFDIGGIEDDYTDRLLEAYKTEGGKYLEELFFQYGRYLLITSCKPDTLPPNLQGIWNQYADAPWTSGYWHNVNIQMNYWMAFGCNLTDRFEAYVNYFKAYLPRARRWADNYMHLYFPEADSGDGKNGWCIGTGAWPYYFYGVGTNDHSGPGTTAFTAMLFWDYYDYTRDLKILENLTYPALYEASLYLSKILIFKDGKWIIKHSASPEQYNGSTHYRTEGAAFDQQMCYEAFVTTVKAAKLLNRNDELIKELEEKIPLLAPYEYGKSGQIKEYTEEEYYGDIGEKEHRHISHLLGIYPGVCADFDDPKLINAVKTTLEYRGHVDIGWASMHRMCLWARVQESQKAYDELALMMRRCIKPNLWNAARDPFQIDGNFGACAGVLEMLLQSHKGYIELIPNLTEKWSNGSFKGLVARGGFEVDLVWENCRPKQATIKSLSGIPLALKIPQGADVTVECNSVLCNHTVTDGIIGLDVKVGEKYTVKFNY